MSKKRKIDHLTMTSSIYPYVKKHLTQRPRRLLSKERKKPADIHQPVSTYTFYILHCIFSGSTMPYIFRFLQQCDLRVPA